MEGDQLLFNQPSILQFPQGLGHGAGSAVNDLRNRLVVERQIAPPMLIRLGVFRFVPDFMYLLEKFFNSGRDRIRTVAQLIKLPLRCGRRYGQNGSGLRLLVREQSGNFQCVTS